MLAEVWGLGSNRVLYGLHEGSMRQGSVGFHGVLKGFHIGCMLHLRFARGVYFEGLS